jgi:hypothetical protein
MSSRDLTAAACQLREQRLSIARIAYRLKVSERWCANS